MEQKFEQPVEMHTVIGDIMGSSDSCRVFCLHGAGQSDRKRYERLRKRLLERGVSSCAFDYPGHGETSGELIKSSLKERTEVAASVIDRFASESPITVMGASMSGYTAVRLLEQFDVETLVLIVPAAYDKQAYELRFDQGFTACIRREKSYLNSDAWDILQQYRGRILLVTAEKDQVIPDEVIKLYKRSAPYAKVEHYIVEGAPHRVMAYMDDEVIAEILEKI